ncbi:hypothetical protein NIES4106_23170 [Fischerella sp. NIES-4106]|jgi:hypothetical protein|nr:hypothetical protein NIES4106_08570 [Fischerella sp. NIES-4106]BAZ67562.1 hypothetical protein NIES4106_23170 [Fischerella sp. NIES-4106]
MKNKQLRLRMSERRFYKLQLCAVQSDKTMTQIIEELIDSLPSPEIGNSCEGLPRTKIGQASEEDNSLGQLDSSNTSLPNFGGDNATSTNIAD